MNKAFAVYRYLVFAIFVACNIAILAVAARNLMLSLELKDGSDVEVDAFLIALGCVGLVFMLPILFIDAMRKESVVRHVWFECFWIGIFCLMQLACAGVVTLTMPNAECVVQLSDGLIAIGPCDLNSTLLMAFTWTAAGDLLVYLIALTAMGLLHHRDDPLIWKAYVSTYSWFAVRRSLGSEPPTPSLPVQSVPKSGQSEFSNRMVAPKHDPDPEKQAMGHSLRVPPVSSAPRLPPTEKAPQAFTPRQLQLKSSVPNLSPATARAIASRRAEQPAATVNRTYVPATRPREPKKKVLRLHRPPSLDLSRITPPR